MRPGAILAASLLLWPSLPQALTTREAERTCPLDGEKFTATVPMSGYMKGRFLDGKPFGSILAPAPLPKCPTTGFVIYKRSFTEDELARLRAYVATPEYRAASAKETTHYLAAMLLEHMGASRQSIGVARVQSTWQAEKGEQYRRYAAEALRALEASLDGTLEPSAEIRVQMMAGELERRLGRFAEARERFAKLAERSEVRDGFLRGIVQQQQALIEAGDSEAREQHVPARPER